MPRTPSPGHGHWRPPEQVPKRSHRASLTVPSGTQRTEPGPRGHAPSDRHGHQQESSPLPEELTGSQAWRRPVPFLLDLTKDSTMASFSRPWKPSTDLISSSGCL